MREVECVLMPGKGNLKLTGQLGEAMKDSGVTRVYTSCLKRAARTGQIVAQCLGVPCEVREGLQETGLGEWEGRVWKDICAEDPEGTERWMKDRRNARPPKGETYQEVLDRFTAAVVRIARGNTQDVMIVTHNGTIKAFLAELNSTPLETMGEDYPTPNAGAIEVDAERILKRFG